MPTIYLSAIRRTLAAYLMAAGILVPLWNTLQFLRSPILPLNIMH